MAMPKKKNYFFLVVAVCLGLGVEFPIISCGQEMPANFMVRVWRSQDGLPSNRVRSIAQAADGWIWVGTAEGVVRFDGLQFTGFKYDSEEELAQLPVRALFALPNGDVWINAVKDGLFCWHAGHLRMVWPNDDPAKPKPARPSVDKIVSDGAAGALIVHGSELWLAKGHADPSRINWSPELKSLLLTNQSSQRDSQGIIHALHDSRGRFWRATGQDLTVTDAAGKETTVPMPAMELDAQINQLTEDSEGNIWLASSDGLMEVCPRPVEMMTFKDGHAGHAGHAGRAVRAVLEDRTGALWVSFREGGLIRCSGGTVTQFNVDKFGAGREILALCEDHTGTIWAARNIGSVICYDGHELKLPPTPLAGLLKVVAMVEDHQGRIWFGDAQGLAVWDGVTVTRCAVPTQVFSALAVDSSGFVWAGTRNGLVFHSRDIAMELAGSVPTSRGISGLLPDSDGSVWISTIGGGLHHLVGKRCFHFSAEQGLPDARLTCVLNDSLGRLWLGSLSGILAVEKSDLLAIESGQHKTAHWLQFDQSDGMQARECVGGPQPAGCRGRDGQLWFSTADGLAMISPDQILKNPVPPAVEIEQVQVNGRVLNSADGPCLAGPGRTQLGFTYTGLSFSAPEKIRFRAKLEGLETAWQEMGDERRISYDSVPPGKYQFRVIAANRDGVWNDVGDSVAVQVTPHFWQRASVQVAGIVLVLGIASMVGWAGARMRMNRRLARIQLQTVREAERTRIARDLHDDLGSSLTHISLFANMAAEQTRAGKDAHHVLPEIVSKVQALVSTLDEIVWTVNPRYDTLASMSEYLTAFAVELLGAAGVALRLEMPRDLPAVTLNAEQRHNLFLAAREALNNAVKHSGAKEVRLCMGVANDCFEIFIVDNGRGFDVKNALHGDGLANLHERLTQIGGSCSINSTLGVGTMVRLSLTLPADAVGRI